MRIPSPCSAVDGSGIRRGAVGVEPFFCKAFLSVVLIGWIYRVADGQVSISSFFIAHGLVSRSWREFSFDVEGNVILRPHQAERDNIVDKLSFPLVSGILRSIEREAVVSTLNDSNPRRADSF